MKNAKNISSNRYQSSIKRWLVFFIYNGEGITKGDKYAPYTMIMVVVVTSPVFYADSRTINHMVAVQHRIVHNTVYILPLICMDVDVQVGL